MISLILIDVNSKQNIISTTHNHAELQTFTNWTNETNEMIYLKLHFKTIDIERLNKHKHI